jgi:hypothetical protein
MKRDDESLLTRYLLSDLPLADQAPIDERLAHDASYFESLCALEDELILKWHRGELSDEESRLFTLTYFSSPGRHARVWSTHELIDVIERGKAAQQARVSIWSRVGRWFAAPRLMPEYVVAVLAAVLVAVMGFAAYRLNTAMSQLKRAERENVELRQQNAAAHRLAVAFTLSPVGERSQEATEGTNVVRIPRQASEVWLQFQIADPGTSAGFDAVLESLERTGAATSLPARVDRMDAAALVTLTLAAAVLPDGDYVLRLRRAPVPSSDIRDVVATRAFRVTHN